MKKKRVLIVDDDPELCEELVEILEGEGFDTDCISDSRKCEKVILNGAYDVIILDYRMPYLTGIDVIRSLQQKKRDFKLFMMSGRPFLEQILIDIGLNDLVSGILAKPIDLKDLLNKLRE